ncbi:MAG: toll/interleukin-1 receptor domain-containing protein [Armatimonadota bacterium]
MRTEKPTTMLMTYISVIALICSITIFSFFFTGVFSREMVVSLAGVLFGVIASMASIFIYTLTKRGTIRVFMSYAYADAERVKEIRDYLGMKGLIVSEPETTVRVGDDISKAVQNAIQASDCIILVLSRQSTSSDWVKKEIEKATVEGKRLYPVLIEDVQPPAGIETIRFADLREPNIAEMRKLVVAIRENHGK